MQPKKSKKEFDSEKRIECGYCGNSMVRRQLTEHRKKFCSVAKGKNKPNWEKAPKGQPTLQFALKPPVNLETSPFFDVKVTFELKKRVSESVQEVLKKSEVKVEERGKKRGREDNHTGEAPEETPEVKLFSKLRLKVTFVRSV